jgi:hypothetical protein
MHKFVEHLLGAAPQKQVAIRTCLAKRAVDRLIRYPRAHHLTWGDGPCGRGVVAPSGGQSVDLRVAVGSDGAVHQVGREVLAVRWLVVRAVDDLPAVSRH